MKVVHARVDDQSSNSMNRAGWPYFERVFVCIAQVASQSDASVQLIDAHGRAKCRDISHGDMGRG